MSGGESRRAWWATLIWLGFQLILTSLPGSTLPDPGIRGLDKLVHFGMYAVLGVLLIRAGKRAGWRSRAAWLVWLAMAALGAADELHQRIVPGRTAELNDWAADVTGAAAGLVTGTLILRSRVAAWLR